MPAIYSNAWNVTIWLGECLDSDCSALALDLLPSILNLRHLDTLLEAPSSEETTRSLLAFANLLCRSWFCRRWVIQEVAYAKRLSVRCGHKVVSWVDFADAVDLFLGKFERILDIYASSALAENYPDALKQVQSSGAGALVSLARNVFRKDKKGSVVGYLADLEFLVLRAAPFAATDERDVIYALLSIVNDGYQETGSSDSHCAKPYIFHPDYAKPVIDVYAEFIEYCIQKSASLDIICRHWALEPRFQWSKLPSWIGLTNNSAYGMSSRLPGRVNGDGLVGDTDVRIYNATRNTTMAASLGKHSLPPSQPEDQAGQDKGDEDWSNFFDMGPIDEEQPHNGHRRKRLRRGRTGIESLWSEGCWDKDPPQPLQDLPHLYSYLPNRRPKIPQLFNGILHAKGVVVGEVYRTSPRVVDGTISNECFEVLGQWEDVPDHLWRILVADRGPDGKAAPSWYRRACALALKNISPEGDMNTSKLLSSKSLPTVVSDYLRRVQSVVWSRKFFKTKPTGKRDRRWYPGMGPRDVCQGDLVCLLFGCSVPVIVRRKTAIAEDKLHVALVGECYVHGIMEGEYFVGGNAPRLSEDTVMFEIS